MQLAIQASECYQRIAESTIWLRTRELGLVQGCVMRIQVGRRTVDHEFSSARAAGDGGR